MEAFRHGWHLGGRVYCSESTLGVACISSAMQVKAYGGEGCNHSYSSFVPNKTSSGAQ